VLLALLLLIMVQHHAQLVLPEHLLRIAVLSIVLHVHWVNIKDQQDNLNV